MTAKKNNQYAKIQTAKELDAAIKRAHAASKKLGRSFEHDLHGLRDNIRPSALVSNAFQSVAPFFAWSEIGLGLVRGLKKLIAPKNPKSADRQSLPPAEESPSASES